ncbi:MAG: hypothetical protein JXQ29_04180 [Planctomycetes bacterium]|nr:hypothetical protein [Planctomycetota bacterium]
MRVTVTVAAVLTCLASLCCAQTVDFSPVNLDAVQPVPGRTFTITVSYPPGPGSVYVLALDLVARATPAKLPGIGELGLMGSPFLLLMKSAALDAQGRGSYSLALPNVGSLIGTRFYFQALVYAKASPGGAYLSNLYVGDVTGAATHTVVPGRARLARALHTATVLQDGRVLIVGGGGGSLTAPQGTQVTEVYYPWTKRFDYTRTPQGSITQLGAIRVLHTATRLDDGRVLIAGGVDSQGNVLGTAEVFDPATGLFTPVGNLVTARATHTATKLPDGRVLIAGGTTASFVYPNVFGGATSATEFFDPKTQTFQAGPTMRDKHMLHAAVPLRVGGSDYVLVMSGINGLFLLLFPNYTTGAEVYDVAARTFTNRLGAVTMGAMKTARAAFGAAQAGSGQVLIVGGASGTVPAAIKSAEEFNPTTGVFAALPDIPTERAAPTVTTLPSGVVLVQGGALGSLTAPQATASCYLWSGGSFQLTAALTSTRAGHAAVALGSGVVLAIGGADTNATPLDTAEYYTP